MKTYMMFAIIVLLALSGCHTSTSFLLPPDTALIINDERVPLDIKDEYGRVTLERVPFFWTSIMGIEYMLVQEDKVIKKDRLPSEFRIASIFWPPYAFIYWPIGFGLDCYDLSDPKKEFIEKCSAPKKPVKENTERPAQAPQ
jgi:hypothetical protein